MKHCDICMKLNGRRQKAYVDGALNADGRVIAGGYSWANMCKTHHKKFGVGIGIGKGQYIPQGVPYLVKGGRTEV